MAELLSNPHFLEGKHLSYIKKVSNDKESFEYVVTQHLRMSGVYWGLTAMCLLGGDIKSEMNSDAIVEWVLSCQDELNGGYVIYLFCSSHLKFVEFLSFFTFYFCRDQDLEVVLTTIPTSCTHLVPFKF